jgi:hypothetical protein
MVLRLMCLIGNSHLLLWNLCLLNKKNMVCADNSPMQVIVFDCPWRFQCWTTHKPVVDGAFCAAQKFVGIFPPYNCSFGTLMPARCLCVAFNALYLLIIKGAKLKWFWSNFQMKLNFFFHWHIQWLLISVLVCQNNDCNWCSVTDVDHGSTMYQFHCFGANDVKLAFFCYTLPTPFTQHCHPQLWPQPFDPKLPQSQNLLQNISKYWLVNSQIVT